MVARVYAQLHGIDLTDCTMHVAMKETPYGCARFLEAEFFGSPPTCHTGYRSSQRVSGTSDGRKTAFLTFFV